MSSDPVIRVENVSKCYEIYGRPQDRLKQSIHRRFQRLLGMRPKDYAQEFWALKDISFEVNKGEAVGIIGRNGAGKSTLLQTICGTLTPTAGKIEIEGTVAALLELGSGLNPEFTGRENIYLSASILGLTEEEIARNFDEIAAFADIGDFLEQPLKVYSSGMLMRLAFAVNTGIRPEILIVDEALGVGDAPFQAKCFKRLRQLISDGTSILFVSHDITTVRSVCSRALWLKGGRVELWGNAKDVAKEYEKFCWQEQGVVLQNSQPPQRAGAERPASQGTSGPYSASVLAILAAPNPTFESNRRRSRGGTGDVVITNFLILNEDGQPVTSCAYDEELTFYYLLDVRKRVSSEFVIGVWFRDLKGNSVYSANDLGRIHTLSAAPGEKFVASAKLRVPLSHQDYEVHTSIFGFKGGVARSSGMYDFARAIIWDMTDSAAYITVRAHPLMPVAGPVGASFDLSIERVSIGTAGKASDHAGETVEGAAAPDIDDARTTQDDAFTRRGATV